MLDKLFEKASKYSGKTADTIIFTKWDRHKAFYWLQYAGIAAITIGLIGDALFSKVGVATNDDGMFIIKALNEELM